MTFPAQNQSRFMDQDAIVKKVGQVSVPGQDTESDPDDKQLEALFVRFREDLRSEWLSAVLWTYNALLGSDVPALPDGRRIPAYDLRRLYRACISLNGFQAVLHEIAYAIQLRRPQGSVDEREAECVRWSDELRRVIQSLPDEKMVVIFFRITSSGRSDAAMLQEHLFHLRSNLKKLLTVVTLTHLYLVQEAMRAKPANETGF